MGILDIFRKRDTPTTDLRLHGKWVLEKADAGFDNGDGVEMELQSGGVMTYAIKQGDKLQIMKMTYRVEGNQIISNQPSVPREEKTTYGFEDGLLVLTFDGSRSWFRRKKEA